MPTDPAAGAHAEADPAAERLNFLCDGVAAIAVTLLALEIRLPEHFKGDVRELLHEVAPAIGAFFLSFLVIANFWLSHLRLARGLVRSSDAFNLASLGFMLALVSLNFPTVVLAHYGAEDPLAVALYAAVVAATGLMLMAMSTLAKRQHLYHPDAERVQQARHLHFWSTLVFLLSVPLALVAPGLAMYSWLLALLGPAASHWQARRSRPAA